MQITCAGPLAFLSLSPFITSLCPPVPSSSLTRPRNFPIPRWFRYAVKDVHRFTAAAVDAADSSEVMRDAMVSMKLRLAYNSFIVLLLVHCLYMLGEQAWASDEGGLGVSEGIR